MCAREVYFYILCYTVREDSNQPAVIQIYIPGRHVPYSHVPIASTTHQCVTPGYHCPHAHNMSGQRSQYVTISVEYVDLCIIQRNHNVVRRKMETRHYAMVRRSMLCDDPAARPPRRLDHVSLLEMRLVGSRFWTFGT